MNKFSLTKSIEAKKLNPRTLVPLPDPEVTIPFGAIIEMLEPDRDMERFFYNHEPYRCPHERLASAIATIIPPVAAGQQAEPAKTCGEKPRLVWERLDAVCSRAKVPGGWLIAGHEGGGIAFYPDPAHEWDGGSIE